jgi:UDP-galactopyranose mutase
MLLLWPILSKFLETTKFYHLNLNWIKENNLQIPQALNHLKPHHTVKTTPVQAESNERKITFNDMHPEIEKVEENKSVDQDLLKHMVALSEGSRQREATSNKKYYL